MSDIMDIARARKLQPLTDASQDRNDHTGALLLIAKEFCQHSQTLRLEQIKRRHIEIGYMTDALLDERNEIANALACYLYRRDPLALAILANVLPTTAMTTRERTELNLRIVAPMRGNRKGKMQPQHDASALPLFYAANEPAML